ncbi:MAG: hypothetical protein BJ554DRAFT_2768, partial [Olpidium bornovanus]
MVACGRLTEPEGDSAAADRRNGDAPRPPREAGRCAAAAAVPAATANAAAGALAHRQLPQKKPTSIDDLPNELLWQVVSFVRSKKDLTSCMLVSHRWCVTHGFQPHRCAGRVAGWVAQVGARGVPVVWPSFVSACPSGVSRPLRRADADADRVLHLFSRPNRLHHTVRALWQKPNPTTPTQVFRLMRTLKHKPQTFAYASFVTKLSLSSLHEQLTDAMLKALTECYRLERLTLGGCRSLTPSSLVYLGACRGLVSVDMSHVVETDDSVLVAFGEHCPKLSNVNFVGCVRITDRGLDALAKGCPLLRKGKFSGCENIGDGSLSTLVDCCENLLELELSHCTAITDAAVRKIFATSRRIRELRLSACTQVTDEAFKALLPRSHDQLRGLDLSLCNTLSDESVARIVDAAPRLRTLALAKCSQLTDLSASAIARLAKTLTHLHM